MNDPDIDALLSMLKRVRVHKDFPGAKKCYMQGQCLQIYFNI